ncbi:MAG: hypothetical protein QOK42_1051 [Frankiaceae bacterium]|nr:hypothetical protein [Frankiaceae bacterium]MDX6226608.1 hypothetical protein [Frankiales bacterium]MDX6273477.1 hypothetical protein [Frankiales bacterium]
MLAVLAAIVFLLGLLKVDIGSISLLYLGLLLLALHLAFPKSVGLLGRRR